MTTVGMKVTMLFFDRKAVTKRVDRTQRRVYSKFGAYVRRRARSSIRRRKRSSLPGKPPSSHHGLLRQLIFFSYDAQRETVVIGPLASNSIAGYNAGGDVPDALEHGGRTRVIDWDRMNEQHRRGERVRLLFVRKTIKARPFMGPAMEHEKPKLPQMWRDSIRA